MNDERRKPMTLEFYNSSGIKTAIYLIGDGMNFQVTIPPGAVQVALLQPLPETDAERADAAHLTLP
jgi:hypothetical protein